MRFPSPLSVLALAAVLSCRTACAELPNILVILTDDQGRGEYSAFGTKDLRTPNLDRLFHEGMTFENFYANSPVCSPSRAALLTGKYPDRVGVPGVIREEEPENSWGWLAPSATLLPKLLKSAGYRTAMVGKWHLGITAPNLPNDRGFDVFRGFLGDMMDDYWTHLRHGQNFMRNNADAVEPKGHATDVFTDWACDFLASRAHAAEPFFLYLAYNAPHDPVQPPPEWLEKVKQREPGLDPKRAQLVALIEHLDSGIGRVLETLDQTSLAANTLVIFTSDNGGRLVNGANNGPWRSGKEHVYEGGLRVPGAARWPARIKAGSRTEHVALSMDIFPTVLAAAGVNLPAGIDGVSFLPTLLGEAQPAIARELYFVRREGGPNYGGKTIEALRSGDWKLLQDSPFAPLELYNVKDDPQETKDLANERKDVFRKLGAALRVRIQQGGGVPWQRPQD
ncbi:MAG: sulfatase-like hydrolase/transferase [Chthoniobacteraceae bacterium]